jgi:hypothetical protein
MSKMDNKMPKHLQIIVDTLLSDNILTSWSVQANPQITTVIIRFKPEDTEVSVQDQDIMKYKRVSPSQLERDTKRAEKWRMATSKDTDKPTPPHVPQNNFDGTKPNQWILYCQALQNISTISLFK